MQHLQTVVEFDLHGGPEVLRARSAPTTAPGAGDVLVAVSATGVNFVDTMLRAGTLPCALPGRLGREGSGVVLATGPGAERWLPGDRVAWTMVDAGSYAEQATIAADRLVAIPDDVDDRDAAAVLTAGITADLLAHDLARLEPGDVALLHAAAGGVGTVLTSLLAGRGVRVVGVVSRPEKVADARLAGAADVVVATGAGPHQEVLAAVTAASDGAGARAVFDSVGRDTWQTSIAAAGLRATIVTYGEASGAVPPIAASTLAARSLAVVRPTALHFIAEPTELRARAARVFAAVRDGRIALPVTAYPLAEAAAAHAALESRATTGKIVLVP